MGLKIIISECILNIDRYDRHNYCTETAVSCIPEERGIRDKSTLDISGTLVPLTHMD